MLRFFDDFHFISGLGVYDSLEGKIDRKRRKSVSGGGKKSQVEAGGLSWRGAIAGEGQ